MQYFNRIYGKTASLFATSAQGGAMVAGLSDEQALALRAYGENIGMAFQVVDDILDFTGSEAEMGKPAGSDLMHGHADAAGAAAHRALPGQQPGAELLRWRSQQGREPEPRPGR